MAKLERIIPKSRRKSEVCNLEECTHWRMGWLASAVLGTRHGGPSPPLSLHWCLCS